MTLADEHDELLARAAPAPPASGQQDAREFLWARHGGNALLDDYVGEDVVALLEAYARSRVEQLASELRRTPDDVPIGAVSRTYECGIALGSQQANEHWRKAIERALRGGGR